MGYLIDVAKVRFLNLGLTERQADVMHRLFMGSTNKEIAKDLKISEKAVKWHLTNIYQLTKAKNRKDLMVYIIQKGIYDR